MKKQSVLRKGIASVVMISLVFSFIIFGNVTPVQAAGTITNDTTNKVVTVTNNNIVMQFNYNNKMVISSMKLGGTVETLETTKPVKSEVLLDNGITKSASYTYGQDSLGNVNDGVISYTDSPRDRWTCYGSGNSSDWVVYDFGTISKTVSSVVLDLYSDGGGVKAPASYNVQYWNGTTWVNCGSQVKSPATPLGNASNTDTFTSLSTTKIRIVFTHQVGSYSGATEIIAYNDATDISTTTWTGTGSLTASPTVSINSNVATFSNISYAFGGSTINETWTVTANDANVSLALSRTYNAAATLADQRSLGFSFKKTAFDVVQRSEDGGSFILMDPNRNVNRFLSNEATPGFSSGTYYNNDKYSFYTANVDLIDKLDSDTLSINVASNRNRATKMWRPTDRNGARELNLDYKLNSSAFSFPAGQYLPLSSYENSDFNAVSVVSGQTDTATFTISNVNNLNKYYNIGTIPAASGLDAYKLAQYMQDFGRSSVVDKNVGMGDCDLSGIGTYETFWYSVNALGLQGAGNEQYLNTLKNFVTLVKNTNYPLHNNGQLFARTCREAGWLCDNLMDGQGQFVLGIDQIFNMTNDTIWLGSIKDMTRSILDYTLSRDTDGDGLVESFNNNTGDGLFSDWNDAIYVAHESSYANAMFYKALVDWADIEEFVLVDSNRAVNYRNKAAQLVTTFNKDVSNGGFWSPTSNQFVYWRDQDGSIHGDVGHVFCNAYPIIFGMVDEGRAQKIMNVYSDFMTSNNLSLMPTQRLSFASNEHAAGQDWKIFENGGIFLQHTYDVMGAFAAVGNKGKVLSMLKIATNLYNTDNLWGYDYLNWDLTANYQPWTEPWMSAGARPASGYYSFILGIQPKYNSIIIDPCADSSLNGLSANYTLRGHNFTIALTSDSVRNITTDGAIPVQSVWSRLPLSIKYKITDENLTNSTTTYSYVDSGVIGKVGYTFTTSGQHKLTLSEDANCSNLVLNTLKTGYPTPSASYTYSQDNVWDAVDGIAGGDSSNTRSRWTSYGSDNTTDWYAVDFGTSQDVGQICMNMYDDGSGVKAPASYNIQYWNGSTWVDCASQSKYPVVPVSGENVVTFTPVNVQKVRVVFTHQTGSYSGLNEFRAYSSYTVNNLLYSADSGNPTPSASFTYTADNVWSAIDGNWTDGNFPRTRWTCYSSGNSSDWYAVNLGSSKSISEVRVNFFSDGLGVLAPASYNVQYWNGTTWVDCASQAKLPATPMQGENKVTFTSVNTSQIRIVLNHQLGKYSGITEFRAYK